MKSLGQVVVKFLVECVVKGCSEAYGEVHGKEWEG